MITHKNKANRSDDKVVYSSETMLKPIFSLIILRNTPWMLRYPLNLFPFNPIMTLLILSPLLVLEVLSNECYLLWSFLQQYSFVVLSSSSLFFIILLLFRCSTLFLLVSIKDSLDLLIFALLDCYLYQST